MAKILLPVLGFFLALFIIPSLSIFLLEKFGNAPKNPRDVMRAEPTAAARKVVANNPLAPLLAERRPDPVDRAQEPLLELVKVHGGFEGELVDTVTIKCDFRRTLEQMIEAAHCEYHNPNMTSANFRADDEPEASGERDVMFAFFSITRDALNDKVIEAIEDFGHEPGTPPVYRAATLRYLCHVGEKMPGLQERYIIIAPGTWWIYPEEAKAGQTCSYMALIPNRILDFLNYNIKSGWSDRHDRRDQIFVGIKVR